MSFINPSDVSNVEIFSGPLVYANERFVLGECFLHRAFNFVEGRGSGDAVGHADK